jgi:phage terminase large subunit-like protein
MVSNVELAMDSAGNIKIEKGKSEIKVDGIVALAMALGGNMASEPERSSIYKDSTHEIPIF